MKLKCIILCNVKNGAYGRELSRFLFNMLSLAFFIPKYTLYLSSIADMLLTTYLDIYLIHASNFPPPTWCTWSVYGLA